jgi:hypothetical protein
LNARAPSEEKSDDSKDSFYEKLDLVFDYICKYRMKVLLGNFNEKLWEGYIFKLTIGNESLHQGSTDNDIRIMNFAISKTLVVKSTVFPHRSIHTYICICPNEKAQKIDHILIDWR